MKFYLGLYDSGVYWDTKDMSHEIEDNKFVIDEVWKMYGEKYSSFGGWYISTEISRNTIGAVEAFHAMGKQCKDVSGGLPTFISPWIDGKKAIMGTNAKVKDGVSVEQHEREWNEIFDGIHDVVDAVAFQDGHIDYDELDAFFSVNLETDILGKYVERMLTWNKQTQAGKADTLNMQTLLENGFV